MSKKVILKPGHFGPFNDTQIKTKSNPYGPFKDRKVYCIFEPLLLDLADNMEWMFKDLIFYRKQIKGISEQSNEMKTALKTYHRLCKKIKKEPIL